MKIMCKIRCPVFALVTTRNRPNNGVRGNWEKLRACIVRLVYDVLEAAFAQTRRVLSFELALSKRRPEKSQVFPNALSCCDHRYESVIVWPRARYSRGRGTYLRHSSTIRRRVLKLEERVCLTTVREPC